MKPCLLHAFLALPVLMIGEGVFADGIGLSLGPIVSNLSPSDSAYSDRFLTPGTSAGLVASLEAPGVLGFRVTGEYFWKGSSPAGWDGEVKAFIVSAMPTLTVEPIRGLRAFGGAGAVFMSGSYSGTDDFGEYVEADGSTVGFGFTVGFEVPILAPLSGVIEYRHAFADLKTDNAVIDGQSSTVYPASETDMGYSQFCISFPVNLFGTDGSIF
jgi:hypothetical protein